MAFRLYIKQFDKWQNRVYMYIPIYPKLNHNSLIIHPFPKIFGCYYATISVCVIHFWYPNKTSDNYVDMYFINKVGTNWHKKFIQVIQIKQLLTINIKKHHIHEHFESNMLLIVPSENLFRRRIQPLFVCCSYLHNTSP